jgi:hypothetical protein
LARSKEIESMNRDVKNKVLPTPASGGPMALRSGSRVTPAVRGRAGGLTRQQAGRAQASLTQAVRKGALVGPEAAFMALVMAGPLEAGGAAVSPSTAVASLPIALTQRLLTGTAAGQEAAQYVPYLGESALGRVASGDLSFAQILTLVPPTVAESMLQDRQKAIQAFFDSWGESLRENAERDKQSALQSQERAQQAQRVDASRAQLKLQQKALGRQKIQLRYEGIFAAALSLQQKSPGALLLSIQTIAEPRALDHVAAHRPFDTLSRTADTTPFRPVPRAPAELSDTRARTRRGS